VARYISTMQIADRKFDGIFAGAASLRAGRSLVLPDVSHELRLQPLRTKFTAYVESAFADRDFVIPGAKVEHWPVEFQEGCPHQPPAVGDALERPAIGTGTAIEQIGSRCRWLASYHPQLPRSNSLQTILAEVRRDGGILVTCKSGTSGGAAETFPRAPASPQ
jgi:hypothetical protein